MREVIVNEWFESEGGYGRVARYSLHPDESSCESFVSSNETTRLKPDGKMFTAEVDDETYTELESAGSGIWYRGKVRFDGEELDLGKPKN